MKLHLLPLEHSLVYFELHRGLEMSVMSCVASNMGYEWHGSKTTWQTAYGLYLRTLNTSEEQRHGENLD